MLGSFLAPCFPYARGYLKMCKHQMLCLSFNILGKIKSAHWMTNLHALKLGLRIFG